MNIKYFWSNIVIYKSMISNCNIWQSDDAVIFSETRSILLIRKLIKDPRMFVCPTYCWMHKYWKFEMITTTHFRLSFIDGFTSRCLWISLVICYWQNRDKCIHKEAKFIQSSILSRGSVSWDLVYLLIELGFFDLYKSINDCEYGW